MPQICTYLPCNLEMIVLLLRDRLLASSEKGDDCQAVVEEFSSILQAAACYRTEGRPDGGKRPSRV